MKKSWKIIAVLFVGVMITVLLASCGNRGTTAGGSEWEVDRYSHWRLDKDGKAVKTKKHSLEEGTCTVCGAQIMENESGAWVLLYNEHDDLIVNMSYDESGNILHNIKNVYTYDSDGRWQTKKSYENGVLVSESSFATVKYEDGGQFTYEIETVKYNEDGSRLVEYYDENGWQKREMLYNADDTVAYDYTVVNEFDSRGIISVIRKYDGETLALEISYEYDENGNLTASRTYSSSVLVKEEYYSFVGDESSGYNYVSKEIVYNRDGSKNITEYDENGEIIG